MVDKMIESRKRVDLAVSALSTVKTSTVYWLYPNSNSIFYPNVEYTYLYSTWNDMKRSHPYKSIYTERKKKNSPSTQYSNPVWVRSFSMKHKYIYKIYQQKRRFGMKGKYVCENRGNYGEMYSIFFLFFFFQNTHVI